MNRKPQIATYRTNLCNASAPNSIYLYNIYHSVAVCVFSLEYIGTYHTALLIIPDGQFDPIACTCMTQLYTYRQMDRAHCTIRACALNTFSIILVEY